MKSCLVQKVFLAYQYINLEFFIYKIYIISIIKMFINNFDPVAFQIMSFEIRWYSLAYIFGIILVGHYVKKYSSKHRY